MMRWPLLGSALAAAVLLRPASAVCWAEGCSVNPGGLRLAGGGTIARAAAARLAMLQEQASENRTVPTAVGRDPGEEAAGADTAASEPQLDGRGPPQEGEESDCWALFAEGEEQSKLAVAADEGWVGPWASDRAGTGVPASMLRAEELMLRALVASPRGAFRREALGASRALRLFQHAKWLAERDHARAAELRFREASREAAEYRRTVLAQHSLARLGYFLAHWGRQGEALEALLESQRFGDLDPERDAVAPFLLGVLARQAAGSDVRKLQEAEERILDAEQQPTEELEAQRLKLQSEIRYWRAAESSPRRCLDADEAVHAMICLGSHAARLLLPAAA